MSGPTEGQITDRLTIALRTFAREVPPKDSAEDPERSGPDLGRRRLRGPSKWTLILDTETTVDARQRLRFGTYQLRYGDELRELGLFYDPDAVTSDEQALLRFYAQRRSIKLLTWSEFSETIFMRVGVYWHATIIGFNLPFDLARIAHGCEPARGRKMYGGFSLQLTPDGRKAARLRTKHLTRRASLTDLTRYGQAPSRGHRKRFKGKSAWRPRTTAFVDVSTIAAALMGRGFNLKGLADELQTPHRKLDSGGHGETLTFDYLDYAMQDVQVTWECFALLRERYALHGITADRLNRIYSEASIGKAQLRQMTIRPLMEIQPDFPPELLARAMNAYFGGRSEARIRREITRVFLVDFTSMYPTVCTLMRLWRFVIARGMTWRDATQETRDFLDRATLQDFQKPSTWARLPVLVQIEPNSDVLPVRAKFSDQDQWTIGLNHLSSREAQWFTLADCLASRILTGRAPKILQAMAFEPMEPQEGLKSIDLNGMPEFHVDPLSDDFYKRLIELRMGVKVGAYENNGGANQQALKLIANATSYGIFMQINVEEHEKPAEVRVYLSDGGSFTRRTKNVEKPGEFFHPLLGTLITGAARLMLAIAERLITDAGLDWAFCDTDSMAIAKPEGMSEDDFLSRIEAIRAWFKPLNPYDVDVDLLKEEDVNFDADGKTVPLYCLAISAKRYTLFNLSEDGNITIRKASAHGLGHLLAPGIDDCSEDETEADSSLRDKVGVTRWQYDYWLRVIAAALDGHPDRVNLDGLAGFDQPAASRYGTTTPRLLKTFAGHNANRLYADQIKPHGFMLSFQYEPLAEIDLGTDPECRRAKEITKKPRPFAPFDRNPARAAKNCFDAETGNPIPASALKSYRDVLVFYHRHPESKFLNGGFADRGRTERRRVEVASIVYIGKEANRLDEQFHLGLDEGAQIEYEAPDYKLSDAIQDVASAAKIFGMTTLANASSVSRQHLAAIASHSARPSWEILGRIQKAIASLESQASTRELETRALVRWGWARCREVGLRQFAAIIGVDAGTLSRIVNSKRKPTASILSRIKRAWQVAHLPSDRGDLVD